MAKEGGLGIVLDLSKPKAGPAEDDEGELSPKQEALSDFFAAGKSGDWAATEDAFLNLMGICYPELKHSGEYEEGETSEEV